MRPFALLAAITALAAVASGCIPNEDADDPSSQQGQQPPNGAPNAYNNAPYNNGAPMNNGAPQPYNGAPQAAPGNYAPGPAGPAPAAAGGAATPIAPAMAAAASFPLQAMATQEAPGMTADGGAFAGQFQEGQTLEQPINLQPNKCYTIVAAGVGVQEIQVQIAAQPFPNMAPVPLAQSHSNGAQATLGGGKSCWRYMAPMGAPAKVLLKVTKGQGMAAAQVFIK